MNVRIAASYFFNRKIELIKNDAEKWKASSFSHRLWYRGTVKAAIAKHDKNLDDCFGSFMVSLVPLASLDSCTYRTVQLGSMIQIGTHVDNLTLDVGSQPGKRIILTNAALFC